MTVSESSILVGVRRLFGEPGYRVIPQVRDATGLNGCRAADAIGVSLWPSRGLEIIGFEFKSARNDWLRELKNPAKAESIFRFCDRWYLAATPGVAKAEELPQTWGMLEVGAKTKTVVKAPKLSPEPLSLEFVASLLRRVPKTDPAEIEQARKDAYDLGRKSMEVAKGENWKARYDGLAEKLREFEDQSGVRIDTWRAGQIGTAVKAVLEISEPTKLLGNYERAVTEFRNFADRYERQFAELKAALCPAE